MSTHEIPIIEIGEILPHPNPEAERLSVVHVMGWQCCVGKNEFKVGDKAVYVEPDYEVPLDRPYFTHLKNPKNENKQFERIRVRKLKGALSQGLVIPLPEEFKDLPVGTNLIEQLGIRRYEVPVPMSTYANFIGAPSNIYSPVFDVENYQKYRRLFIDGEEVISTEKLNGSNARFCFAKDSDGNWQQFVGTHYNWVKEDEKNIWWKAFNQCPAIGQWCQANPEVMLYGEVFGHVGGGWDYSSKPNDVLFAGFAILNKQAWLDYDVCQESIKPFSGLNWVPLTYRGPFNEEFLLEEAEKNSLWKGYEKHIREGIVVQPVRERLDNKIGRVFLKIVSNNYHMSKK